MNLLPAIESELVAMLNHTSGVNKATFLTRTLDAMLLGLFSIYLLIDAVNGYQIYNFGSSITSISYKAIIFVVYCSYAMALGRKAAIYLVTLLSYFLLALGVKMISTLGDEVDVVLPVRLLAYFIAVFLFSRIRIDAACAQRVFLVIVSNYLVITLSVIFGLLGFGLTTYGSQKIGSLGAGFGFKGYFYAGNELGVVMIFLYSLLLCLSWEFLAKNSVIRLMSHLLALFVVVLIATKTAMLGLFLITIVSEFLIVKRTGLKRGGISSLFFCVLLVSIPIVIIALGPNLGAFLEAYFERFSSIYNRQGILGLIFSNRDSFLEALWSYWSSMGNLGVYLFGVERNSIPLHIKDSVEIDFFDVLFWLGSATVVFLYLSYAILILSVSRLCRSTNGHARDSIMILSYMLWILLVVSFVSGHVFTSGMLMPILPAVLYVARLKVKRSLALDNL